MIKSRANIFFISFNIYSNEILNNKINVNWDNFVMQLVMQLELVSFSLRVVIRFSSCKKSEDKFFLILYII